MTHILINCETTLLFDYQNYLILKNQQRVYLAKPGEHMSALLIWLFSRNFWVASHQLWFMVIISNAVPRLDISHIYFSSKWTNPERHFLKTICRKTFSKSVFHNFFSLFTIFLNFSKFLFNFFMIYFQFFIIFFQFFMILSLFFDNCFFLLLTDKVRWQLIPKILFAKCPLGNWFLRCVFQDLSFSVKSRFGKCPFGPRFL